MLFRRSHLRDIRDRSVLRLFESDDVVGSGLGVGMGITPGAIPTWDQDQSYFSEPEFDSDYQHQHIHKTKVKHLPLLELEKIEELRKFRKIPVRKWKECLQTLWVKPYFNSVGTPFVGTPIVGTPFEKTGQLIVLTFYNIKIIFFYKL